MGSNCGYGYGEGCGYGYGSAGYGGLVCSPTKAPALETAEETPREYETELRLEEVL